MNFLRKIVKWLGILVLGFGLLLAFASAIDGKMDNAVILMIVFGLPGGILWKIGRGGKQAVEPGDDEPVEAPGEPARTSRAARPTEDVEDASPEITTDTLFSLQAASDNEAAFASLLDRLGCGDATLLDMYFRLDPRFDADNDSSLYSKVQSRFTPENSDLVTEVVNTVSAYLKKPDIYTLWKFMLLAQYVSETEIGSDSGMDPGWLGLRAVGEDLENCGRLFEMANEKFSDGTIPLSNYENAIYSIVLCRLEFSLNGQESTGRIHEVLMLAYTNDALDGHCVADTDCGVGEILNNIRRTIEEFTSVAVSVPEDCDPEEDAYLDNVDWHQVAESISVKYD